ncbi:MAG: hypothetical protein LBC17_02355 [Lactobacillaceae bacterium]|jgi:23S rRNA (guanosine2251-2'-O)-methyltransferase|nr:hypothetical protein [Lactobacillaceae bacterium]
MNDNLEIIFGIHAVNEAIKNNATINKIYISDSLNKDKAREIENTVKKAKLVIQKVSTLKLKELTNNQVHQGVAASIAAYEYVDVDDILQLAKSKNEDPFIVILDEIEDPHNLGSILRTADAAIQLYCCLDSDCTLFLILSYYVW